MSANKKAALQISSLNYRLVPIAEVSNVGFDLNKKQLYKPWNIRDNVRFDVSIFGRAWPALFEIRLWSLSLNLPQSHPGTLPDDTSLRLHGRESRNCGLCIRADLSQGSCCLVANCQILGPQCLDKSGDC